MIDLAKVSALLEKVIQPFVADNIATKTLFYQFTTKTAKRPQVEGTTVYFPVRVSRFAQIYGVPDSETQVGRGEAQYEQARFNVKLYAASFEITKKVLSVGNDEEVVSILSRLSKDSMNDFIWALNRDFFLAGNGVIGKTASAGTSTTTLTLIPYNFGTDNGDVTAADLLTPGDYIKIGTNAAVTVVSVNDNTVTISAAQSWAANTDVKIVTINGNTVDAIDGLQALVDNTLAYGNLNPATYPVWKAYRDVPATATPLSLTDLYKAYSAINKLGEVDYLFMNRTLFNKYGSLLQAQIRFTAKEVLHAGWKGLEFMGGNASIILDYHCPSDAVYFISSKNLYRLEIQPPQFEKGTDGQLLRNYGGLKYEAVLTALLNLATDVRGAHGIVGNRTA